MLECVDTHPLPCRADLCLYNVAVMAEQQGEYDMAEEVRLSIARGDRQSAEGRQGGQPIIQSPSG